MNPDDPWSGPCKDNPDMWDLDVSQPVDWLRAIQTCIDCPVLRLCTEFRQRIYPTSAQLRGDGPPNSIWAGLAYGETGSVLDNAQLRRLAAKKRNRLATARRSGAVA